MDFVYTHSTKEQAASVIKEFVNMAAISYGYKVRFFRTDGERSLEQEFKDLIASEGIITERSSVDTPAQNGAAERSGG